MSNPPEFSVYLSSTIEDLAEERTVAIESLRRHAVVKDSYRASEKGTVITCTQDVREASLYIGIIGQRYGWIPADEDNPDSKSITELEYEACQREGHVPIPRLIFVRTTNPDRFTDALNRPKTVERIRRFRERNEQQSFQFDTIDKFRVALSEGVMQQRAAFHREKGAASQVNFTFTLRRPAPQDFTGYLAVKREGFVGREWLFEQISVWVAGESTRSMLIAADPGFGKSAIIAEMVERREAMGIVAWFCCRWDYPDQLSPRVFVEAIAASLAENLPAYAQALKTGELQALLERAQSGTQVGPRTLFEQLVLIPLAKLPNTQTTPRLILIDALDESLCMPQSIVDLLADTINQLPRWLRIVATSRAYPDVLQSLNGMQAFVLKADDIPNNIDLDIYVASRLHLPLTGSEHTTRDSLDSYILAAAQGNFLIAKSLINEIDAGHLRVDELQNSNLNGGNSHLPPGLQLFYERSFSHLFPTEADFESAATVLALALAALEPLDLPILQAASGVEKAKLGSVLKTLSSFLPARPDKRFTFFHKSVHDWLNAATVDDYYGNPLAKRFAIDIQVGQQLLVKWSQQIFKADRSTYKRRLNRGSARLRLTGCWFRVI